MICLKYSNFIRIHSHTYDHIRANKENGTKHFRNLLIFDNFVSKIKAYCKTPRTKESLAKFFGYDEKHPAYFINSYVIPLIE